MSAATTILVLKIAVVAVTLLLAVSLWAVWHGRYTLHGRLNVAFFVLTLLALVGLEIIARVVNPDLFREHFERHEAQSALRLHLSFSMPAAVLLPLMPATGWRRRRSVHIGLGALFLVLWAGTFVTGIFFLPHAEP